MKPRGDERKVNALERKSAEREIHRIPNSLQFKWKEFWDVSSRSAFGSEPRRQLLTLNFVQKQNKSSKRVNILCLFTFSLIKSLKKRQKPQDSRPQCPSLAGSALGGPEGR